MTAAEVMHTPVFSIQASEPVARAIDIMNHNNISQLPV
ncbi:MAG TPA: CBS domain-containing protein, partial [Methanoregulaceae archaeon]|nr:CBS domain-containing protein [Methanoregulaceae archaeon]